MVSVPHPKGGTIVWTRVKYHIIDEKEDYKEIGLVGSTIAYLRKNRVGGNKRD